MVSTTILPLAFDLHLSSELGSKAWYCLTWQFIYLCFIVVLVWQDFMFGCGQVSCPCGTLSVGSLAC